MIAQFSDDELLSLSGIQHFAFCERQWALIHVEQLWVENRLTVEGRILHRRVDEPFETELRGDTLITRSQPIVCRRLGYYGIADVVEFHRASSEYEGNLTVKISGRQGLWTPFPIEYKRGREKYDDWDEVQLCAQAIALEEMLNTTIMTGALFYGEHRRRCTVQFGYDLRNRVESLFAYMRKMFNDGTTPKAKLEPKCKNCSLFDLCMPKSTLSKSANLLNFVDQLDD